MLPLRMSLTKSLLRHWFTLATFLMIVGSSSIGNVSARLHDLPFDDPLMSFRASHCHFDLESESESGPLHVEEASGVETSSIPTFDFVGVNLIRYNAVTESADPHAETSLGFSDDPLDDSLEVVENEASTDVGRWPPQFVICRIHGIDFLVPSCEVKRWHDDAPSLATEGLSQDEHDEPMAVFESSINRELIYMEENREPVSILLADSLEALAKKLQAWANQLRVASAGQSQTSQIAAAQITDEVR